MRFSLGCLLAGVLLTVSRAASLPELVIPQGVGVNIHFTKGHQRDLDLLAAAGFKWVRMDFTWAATERAKGVYDWSAYDELTANLERRGVRALYILDYSNPLYEQTVSTKNPITGQEERATAAPQHPESVAAFARWAAAAAAHFRGKPVVWEIWNEPNINFWRPKPDVNQYITLATATCKAIREADPEATVIAPATSGIPMEFLESFFKSGILAELDAVSVHPYRNYSRSPETVSEDYAKLRALIARYTPPGKRNLAVISGEWGYASHEKGVSVETQAAYLVRQQLVNLVEGVPLSIWYDWKNDGPDPGEREHNFGTVTSELKLKPAYVAVQTLTRELAGYKIDRRLKTDSAKDYLLLCVNARGAQKLAAWTLAPSHAVALAVTEPAKPIGAVDSDGRAFQVKREQNGIVLELGPSPVYVSLGQGVVGN